MVASDTAPLVSVIVPSFNERDNIERMVLEIEETLERIPHEVIYVDDSTDDTPEILRLTAEKCPNLRFEHREGGRGLSSAVVRGFTLARGTYLSVMDADLQHPIILLQAMYAALESGADMCIPSRHIPGGGDGEFAPHRRFISWTAREIGKLSLPCLKPISDPTGGVFMFRADRFDGFDQLGTLGWKIMVEVIASGRIGTIVEIPYTFQLREAGESKLSKSATLEYLQQLRDLRARGLGQSAPQVTRWTIDETAEKTAACIYG